MANFVKLENQEEDIHLPIFPRDISNPIIVTVNNSAQYPPRKIKVLKKNLVGL